MRETALLKRRELCVITFKLFHVAIIVQTVYTNDMRDKFTYLLKNMP